MRIIRHNSQTPEIKFKQRGRSKSLETLQIKIHKLFCYECHKCFPNVQSFKSHRHGYKEEEEDKKKNMETSTSKTTTNNRTSSSNVKNQLLWASDHVPLIDLVTESVDEKKGDDIQYIPKNTNNASTTMTIINNKSSTVKEKEGNASTFMKKLTGPESTKTNLNSINSSNSISKPVVDENNTTKIIYIGSKSDTGNNDSNIIINQHLPGKILSSTSINLKDLKDYFRCYKCNSSYYNLQDLVLHFRHCKVKSKTTYHVFNNLKCLKQDKNTQTEESTTTTDTVENDKENKENTIPIPADSSSFSSPAMEIDHFDEPRLPSPIPSLPLPSSSPPPLSKPSEKELNNGAYNNQQPSEKELNNQEPCNNQQPSVSTSSSNSISLPPLQQDTEVPELPCEFVNYQRKPTVKYLETVRNGTTEEGTFKCRICEQVFTRNHLLYDHLLEHQKLRSNKTKKCPTCDFRAPTILDVDEHVLKMHPSLHVGFHCNRRKCPHPPFPNQQLLMQHQQEAHTAKKGPFICHLCGVVLKLSTSLQRHLLLHETDRPIKCKYPDCDKSFTTTLRCQEHEITHDKVRFKCTEEGCDKSFHKSSLLRDHNNEAHLGVKPYTCAYPNCEETFSTMKKRNAHSFVHREAKFKCQVVGCNAAFKKSGSLRKHSLRHGGISAKKFKCTYPNCSFRSTNKTSLRLHIEGTHKKIKRFLCTTCGYSCYTSSGYRHHLLSHSNSKPFKCDSCDMAFKDRASLKHHKIAHTDERPLSCEFCDKLFKQRTTLLRHLQIHTKFKPYRCVFCSAQFPDNRPLKKHVAREHEGEHEFDLNIPATYQVYVKRSKHKPNPLDE